jgi:uncharacterized cupin superfamily protein
MHVHDGEITLTVPGEAPQTVGPGQSIFVPQGKTVAWNSATTVTKLFCMIGSAP